MKLSYSHILINCIKNLLQELQLPVSQACFQFEVKSQPVLAQMRPLQPQGASMRLIPPHGR